MKTIRIDDEVFARIQDAATPLVDDANSALRKLLGLPLIVGADRIEKRKRTPSGELTQHPVLRRLILKVLNARGGSATRREVLEQMDHELAGKLTEADLERTQTGEFKWENRASWERQNMVIEGLLKKDSSHGIWELSERGLAEAQAA